MLAACATPVDEGPESYVVRPADTLYSIAWRHDLDFRDLARWNRIGPDFRIAVGQVLILGPNPGMGRTPPQSRPGAAAAARAASRGGAGASGHAAAPAAAPPAPLKSR